MLRLSIFAIAVIYVGLTILSEKSVANADVAGGDSLVLDRTIAPPMGDGVTVMTADGRSLTIVAIIDPNGPSDVRDGVPLVVTPRSIAPIAPETPAPMAEADRSLPLAEVTGTQVNLRAGPSTRDPVLAALRQGDQVALIGATGDGWAQIRVVSDGREGFMAMRFLSPMN